MGVYDPLYKYLSTTEKESVQMTFSDIEALLGRNLPRSAYEYGAWWANGGHSQAYAWLNAGYKVVDINLGDSTVLFSENGITKKNLSVSKPTVSTPAKSKESLPVSSIASATLEVYGYPFTYLQDLIPECDSYGKAVKYYPQSEYDNKDNLALMYHGKGAFCRFSIKAENWPGVYLWVVDGQIIYIGETAGLKQRFNIGYGCISPRNCYVGGQSTNCKMNKVVLGYFERGKKVSLYFYQTTEYKRVELDLLNKIYTPYNVKDN